MFTFIKNILVIITKKPGTYWLLGNITPGQAFLALALPFLAGAILAGLAVWAIMHKRPTWTVYSGGQRIKDTTEQLFVTLNSGCWRYCVKCKDGLLEVDPENGFYDVVRQPEEGFLVYELPITTRKAVGYLKLDGFVQIPGLVFD